MKGADLPVSIDPNDHFAHHNILLKSPRLTNCQCLSTSNHLRINTGNEMCRKKLNLNLRYTHTWNIANVVVTGWWWTARGTGSRSWIGCTVTRSPCILEKVGIVQLQVQQPSMLHQASWSVKVLPGQPHYMRPPGFPRGRSHAGPAGLSTPFKSSKSRSIRFKFSKPFPQRWCKDFQGPGTDSLSNTVQVFCKHMNVNWPKCPNKEKFDFRLD